MKLFRIVTYILGILGIIFIFFDWKLAIGLLLLASIFKVIPLGPSYLLSVITGYFMIGGVIYLFFDWRIGVVLVIAGFLVARFRVWSSKQS